MSFTKKFFKSCTLLLNELNHDAIENVVKHLRAVRDNGGRLIVIGSGGGAGHASHATCDFRKICNIEAYAPYDNVSELTARVNDEGWDVSLSQWLKSSRLNDKDGIFVFSVGGGSTEKKISMNIVNALQYAKQVGAKVLGVVGKDGGYTATIADAAIIIPVVDEELTTPLTEGFQAIVWHLLVSHPLLQVNPAKWESLTNREDLLSILNKAVEDRTIDSVAQGLSKVDHTAIKTKIFADGAKAETIRELYKNPLVAGFTTNPTLMRKAGVEDYETFAREILRIVNDKPISFEVFSDDFGEMEDQAKGIASWGENVYIKIPITNTKGESSGPLIEKLALSGVKINVTAMTMVEQLKSILPYLIKAKAAYASVFAGRIADCGIDPLPIVKQCLELIAPHKHIELIWASPREVFNVRQAQEAGCHIITVTDDIFKKLPLIGKDLKQMSLDTVKMFYDDAVAAHYSIETKSAKVSSAPY